MTINLIRLWERDYTGEAIELERFALSDGVLKGMRESIEVGTKDRLKNGVLSPDVELKTWQMFWDEAAKHFKKQHGYLPIMRARRLLATRWLTKAMHDKRWAERKPTA